MSRRAASFGIYDEISSREEFVGELCCRVEVTAAVVAEVEYEAFHPLFLEEFHFLHKLLIRFLTKSAQSYVSHAGSNHIGGVDTRYRYVVALDSE